MPSPWTSIPGRILNPSSELPWTISVANHQIVTSTRLATHPLDSLRDLCPLAIWSQRGVWSYPCILPVTRPIISRFHSLLYTLAWSAVTRVLLRDLSFHSRGKPFRRRSSDRLACDNCSRCCFHRHQPQNTLRCSSNSENEGFVAVNCCGVRGPGLRTGSASRWKFSNMVWRSSTPFGE